ncbi:hypothetical protein GCM10007897_05780 [Sphingobium jiangsuense]|uniref:Feruloyl esterase n=1 Tax=Sphingobium jiangsuense TaxID=870476 RepID=A0A7W6BFL9_9SPHN|nr:tannase/feruloyl esterase family alpha/beta hydrolase [Sphingobium jiangsuense]MBB3926086.1 feruloyl esterase [Sphingobium jiangsuense]GLS99199.1 hypothetical protein GCM10007897_05780 [Sphingobium jiangsuense]
MASMRYAVLAVMVLPLLSCASGGAGGVANAPVGAAPPREAAASPAACAALAGRIGDLMVTAATPVMPAPAWTVETDSSYEPLPVTRPLCRVEGTIEGNIGFEAWLPHDWNGRLLAGGVGGPAGQFNYRDMSRRTEEGFATFSTDSGHKKTQTRWMADAKAREDYEHRATHLSAVAAKALVERFYGAPARRSYFLGCSGGGRQALKEMQVYPADFDGVIAGAPGPNMPLQSVRMMWFSLRAKQNPAAAPTDADWDLYEKAATNACDTLDGVKDGIISHPPACRFDIAALACKPGEAKACLAPEKVALMREIIAPLRDEAGKPMDGGLVAGVRTRPGPPSPLLRAMWADGIYDDPDWDEDSFRRTADLAAVHAKMPQLRADSTAIDPFLAGDRKAIIYQGWADPSTNAGPTIDYYSALAERYGGFDRISDNVRLFMVPGMYHCRGGPGPEAFGGSGHPTWPGQPDRDILWAMIRWVEQGQAPEQLNATGKSADGKSFVRPLCPYPARAVYKGGGADPASPGAFECAR